MAQSNVAEVVKAETPAEKLARLERENAAMRADIAANEPGNAPDALDIRFEANGKQIFSDMAVRKNFSSGSRGYYAGGKMTIAGKRYQLTCSIVEIGSKPVAK